VRSIAAAGRLLVAFLLGIGVAAGPVLAQPAQPEKPKEDAKPEKLLHSVQLTADGKDEKLHSLDVRRADAAPASLEQLLAEAMKNNPDIRVAEAKLREAEAVLNQARLQAT
jgi:outer membrane protein TolC